MPNMTNIIKAPSKQILLRKAQKLPPRSCRTKAGCPMNSYCRQRAMLYQATITTDNVSKSYREFAIPILKSSVTTTKNYSETKKSIQRHYQKPSGTLNTKLEWKVLERAPSFTCGGSQCNLCLMKKLAVSYRRTVPYKKQP